MIDLDSKDRKILYLLHKNCRLSNSQIGRMVRLSKDGVKYRVNNFVKDGLVRGFFLNIGITTMGYVNFIVYIRLHNTDDKRLANLLNSVKQKNYVIYCATCLGKWDISLQILSRSILTFEKYLNEIIDIIGPQLSDYYTFISFKEYKVYSNIIDEYFKGVKLKYIPKYRKPFNKIKLDELDKKILYLLAENARMPLYIIAKKTNKSMDVVRYRQNKLEDNGYMFSYDILLDNSKFGYAMNLLFLYIHNMTGTRESELSIFFQRNPYIRWAHKTISQQVILVETLTNSQKLFQNLINELKNKFSDIIVSYDSILEIENHKDITIPNLDEMDAS